MSQDAHQPQSQSPSMGPKKNNFDLHLDRWSKLSTILIGVLSLLATVIVTAWVIFPGHIRDTIQACRSSKFDAIQIIKENPDTGIGSLAEDVSKLCNLDLDSARRILSEFRVDSEIVTASRQEAAQREVEANTPLSGFISLGRSDDYQSSNFRIVATDQKALKNPSQLEIGTILSARWSVNLRENMSDTESQNNPILITIQDEACVQLTGRPEVIRESYWAAASLVQCP